MNGNNNLTSAVEVSDGLEKICSEKKIREITQVNFEMQNNLFDDLSINRNLDSKISETKSHVKQANSDLKTKISSQIPIDIKSEFTQVKGLEDKLNLSIAKLHQDTAKWVVRSFVSQIGIAIVIIGFVIYKL